MRLMLITNMQSFSVITCHDVRFFKPFDVQMSSGSDSFFCTVPDGSTVLNYLMWDNIFSHVSEVIVQGFSNAAILMKFNVKPSLNEKYF